MPDLGISMIHVTKFLDGHLGFNAISDKKPHGRDAKLSRETWSWSFDLHQRDLSADEWKQIKAIITENKGDRPSSQYDHGKEVVTHNWERMWTVVKRTDGQWILCPF